MVRVCEQCVQKHVKYCIVKEEDVQEAFGPQFNSEIRKHLPSRTYHDRSSDNEITVFAADHCEKVIESVFPVQDRYSSIQILRASVKTGLSALVHLGYLMQPFNTLYELNGAQVASKSASMNEIISTVGGARTSELRYCWGGLQSAVECQCGIEGEN